MNGADGSDGGGSRGDSPRNLSRTVVEGLAWTSVIFGAQAIAQLGFTAILARLLSPHEYGVVAAASVFIQFATLVTSMGVRVTIMQIPVLDLQTQRAAYGLAIITYTIGFAASFLLAPLVAAWFKIAALVPVVRVLSFYFLTQAVGALSESRLYRELRTREVYFGQFLSFLFANIIVTIPMALLGYSYWSLVAGTLAQASAFMLFARLRMKAPLLPSFSAATMKGLLRKSAGFSAIDIAAFVGLQGDNIVVGRYLSASALGLYSRAFNLMSVPNTIYASVAERVVFPAMARVQNDLPRLKAAYMRGIALTSLVGFPLTGFLVVSAPQLIRAVFGPKWLGAIDPFAVLAISMYPRLSWRVSISMLKSRGHLHLVFLGATTQALIVIGGAILAYPYGLNGVAAAVSLSFLVGFAIATVGACRVLAIGGVEFIRVQSGGFCLGVLVAGTCAAVSVLCRLAVWPATEALLLMLAASGGVTLAAVTLAPDIFVGPTAAPVIETAKELLRGAAAKAMSRFKHPEPEAK